MVQSGNVLNPEQRTHAADPIAATVDAIQLQLPPTALQPQSGNDEDGAVTGENSRFDIGLERLAGRLRTTRRATL